MKNNARLRFAVSLAAGAVVAVLPGLAQAGGFALLEQSARSLGRAHSGGAALINDASAVFYNPAALMELKAPSLMVGATAIKISADFDKQLAVDAAGRPLSGPEDGGAHKTGYLPALFFGAPINDRLAWGIGIYAPFGLNTDYPSDAVTRYQAIYSGIAAVNVNPSIAYRINDVYSIGLGLDIQRFSAKLTNDVDYGAVCFGSLDPVTCQGLGLTPQSHDGYAGIEGDSTDYGWNIGLFADYGATQIGLAYRSSIQHDLNGDARFEAVPALFAAQGLFQDGGATAGLKTPDMASLSFAHELNRQWTISGDVTYLGWSSFNELRVDFDNPAQPDTVQPENWQNTWRYSVGVDWHYNSAWTLRGGLAFDESPIEDQYRTARLPGADRRWVALGATWHMSDNASWDIGYAHLFLSDSIPADQFGQTHDHLKGTYDVATDIASLDFRYTF